MSLDLTNNNEIIVCTNQEDTESRDYTYLSSWNGSNTCLSTYTAKCGIDEYEDSSTENTCIAVSIWEYSPANNNDAETCTNNEDTTSRNYTYTSDGNGTNSCSATYTDKCWVDLYETVNGTCAAVWNWSYSLASNNDRIACTNNEDTTSRNYTYTSDGNGWNNCSATYTDKCWVDLYETVNGTCANVGNWYYSLTTTNTRTACTNNEDTTSRDYTYTSDGNGSNNCNATYTDKCWVDLYETSNGVCAAVWTWYYSASNTNERSLCTTAISNSNYISDGNWSNSCSWECNTNYTLSGWVCTADGRNCTITNWTWNQVWNGSAWWTCTVVTCNTDYYSTNNTSCIAVWTWYYSNSTSKNRTACTNDPDTTSRNYSYTSDGNWSNSCSATYTDLCWVDKYESSNGVCSNVWTGYYSGTSNNSRTACTNKPGNTYYTSDGNGSNSCSWSCNSGYAYVALTYNTCMNICKAWANVPCVVQ